jgi:hypothetical protein
MRRKRSLRIMMVVLALVFLSGCATGGPAVREGVKVDMKVPVGKVEGNQFNGIRYPFTISLPPNWEATTEYPKFLIGLGFEEEGLKDSQVFIFNPATQSNLQIDFSPAGRRVKFDQRTVEWITDSEGASFESEFHKDYGKDAKFSITPTTPCKLKGVPYAAKRATHYTANGIEREHGWIYAFAEPYQIFLIYMTLEKGGAKDSEDMQAIIDSFSYIEKK